MKNNANATQPKSNDMRFTKQSFMGINLDILVGHPEHDILFIATQVARAAGLKSPSYASSVMAGRVGPAGSMQWGSLRGSLESPKGLGRPLVRTTWIFTEATVYQMLLRGHAPASEPFRKWVTEVVLPSIRKTGKFDVTEATDETSQQYAGEFAALHAKINGLEAMLKELMERPVAGAAEPSPYEGTTMSSLSDNLLFDRRTFREVGESIGLVRPGIDKLEPYVLLAMEIELGKVWAEEDGRPLKEHVSTTKRKWTQWPSSWVKSKMDRSFYRQVTLKAINERTAVL